MILSKRAAITGLVVVLVLIVMTYPFTSIAIPDEDVNVYIGVKIYETGRWLAPPSHRTSDNYYKDKPPFYLWYFAVVAGYWGSLSPLMLGLPSLLSAGGVLFLVYFWVKNQKSAQAALASLVVLFTTGLFLFSTQTLRMDMTMTFFTILAGYSFWYEHKSEKPQYYQTYFFLVLSVLVKGGGGVYITLFPFAVYLLLWIGWQKTVRFFISPGAALFLVIIASWFGIFYLKTGYNPIQGYLLDHTVKRAIGGGPGPVKPWYYFLVMAPFALAPWLFLYGHAVFRTFWEDVGRLQVFLLTWILAGYTLLCFLTTKIFLYQLPLLIPLCIIGGITWTSSTRGKKMLHLFIVHLYLGAIAIIALIRPVQGGYFTHWITPMNKTIMLFVGGTLIFLPIQFLYYYFNKTLSPSIVIGHFITLLVVLYGITLPFIGMFHGVDYHINWAKKHCTNTVLTYKFNQPRSVAAYPGFLFTNRFQTTSYKTASSLAQAAKQKGNPCILTRYRPYRQTDVLTNLTKSNDYRPSMPPMFAKTGLPERTTFRPLHVGQFSTRVYNGRPPRYYDYLLHRVPVLLVPTSSTNG